MLFFRRIIQKFLSHVKLLKIKLTGFSISLKTHFENDYYFAKKLWAESRWPQRFEFFCGILANAISIYIYFKYC